MDIFAFDQEYTLKSHYFTNTISSAGSAAVPNRSIAHFRIYERETTQIRHVSSSQKLRRAEMQDQVVSRSPLIYCELTFPRHYDKEQRGKSDDPGETYLRILYLPN